MPSYSDPTVISVSDSTKIQPGTILVMVAGILAVLMIGGFWYERYLTNRSIIATDASIAKKEDEIAVLQPIAEELTRVDRLAKDLHSLFENQKRWEKVLGRVEDRFYRHMVLTSFAINEQGVMVISGITPNFDNYAKLYASLTDTQAKQFFTSARPVAVTRLEKGGGAGYEVGFTFNLTLAPSVFLEPTPSPSPAASSAPSPTL